MKALELAMSAPAGWALAVAAIVIGHVSYGWPGVALAFTVIAFWLLLQFSRAVRTMRDAAGAPIGYVANAKKGLVTAARPSPNRISGLRLPMRSEM